MLSEDHKWKEMLKEDYLHVQVPAEKKEDSWDSIVQELSNEPRKNRRASNKWMLVAAMLVFMVIGTILVQSNQTQAFNWIISMFETSNGNVTQINQSNTQESSTADDDVPDFTRIETESVQEYREEMSFEEAQEVTEFHLSQPTYLPKNYVLDDIIVLYEEDTAKQVEFHYIDESNNYISLQQIYQANDFADAKVIDNQDTEVETITLHGGEARMLIYEDDQIEMIWSTTHMNWVLEGTEDKQEMINIAEAIE
ncbi:DUF4367 domain-containing protein [Gracilibacillus sp. S3-1-1]|uniref:DUF4367 domain-containing protein n=1 Tax=Gracilibacillus pellucidus TaxID=3095368 RepID=A0ACC6M5Z6_9BACI|nr:DUF4367 domain-containing protein [Gracilibacillus sp. S3-1-1]MDX8046408.1 DUF4367 domain-containing protein [Gracilibacillus sp. S3-1-1]